MLVLENKEIIWDEGKNAANKKKHGLTFQEAALIFLDACFVVMLDESHSSQEETRWKGIGALQNSVLITVVFAERGETLRLISARKSTKKEQEDYRANIGQVFGY
jgi:uncharacterized DUF497 family protein